MTAAEALAATSPEGLLRTYAALTHHMHEAEHPVPGLTIIQSEKVTDLRRQRDLVAGELLRRIEPVDPEHPAMPPILFGAEACDSWVEQVTRLQGWEVRVTQTDGTVITGELIRGTYDQDNAGIACVIIEDDADVEHKVSTEDLASIYVY